MAIVSENVAAFNKVKGIAMSVKNNEITFQNLYDTLLNINTEEERKRNIVRFHHKNHDIYTVQESKVALDRNDNKRIILNDNISTLAHGHYKLNSN